MGQFEVAVFSDTVRRWQTEFYEETEKMLDKDVEVYTRHIVDTQFMPHQKMPNNNMLVEVVNDGTVNAGRKYAVDDDFGRVAILNFADALVPGGLVLTGATTQEENICRCSNLYAALTCKQAKENYYDVNNNSDRDSKLYPDEWRPGMYTDNIIYARDVLFFKEDVAYKDVEPYRMDVITCPAPAVKLPAEIEHKVILDRVTEIIKAAILNKVDVLILGAWGCGAFGQNPEVISKAFMEVIRKYPAFDKVVFAVRDCEADYGRREGNYKAFLKNCSGV